MMMHEIQVQLFSVSLVCLVYRNSVLYDCSINICLLKAKNKIFYVRIPVNCAAYTCDEMVFVFKTWPNFGSGF
jgi:hypothetical protein